MKVWAITFTEYGQAETVAYESVEGSAEPRFLVFADSAYAQAVQAFGRMCDDRLSFHKVTVLGTFGADAHAHLCADDGDDAVELRPYDVIGG